MIYIRPASISWTHCIHSVSCSFGLLARLCKDEPLLRCIIAWDLREVSGCFGLFQAAEWERSFPTKAPLAQSDPQLQDGLKAMQTLVKDLYQRCCHVLFWHLVISCPPALFFVMSSQKKVTGLTSEAACLSVSHWRLLRATCAGEWDHRFRIRFRDHQKNKVFVYFVCVLWNVLYDVIVALTFTDWLPSRPGRRVLWWGRTTTCRLPSGDIDLRHFLRKAMVFRHRFIDDGGLSRAKVRREGIGRLLDLRPDMSTCRCPAIRTV